MHQHEIVMLAHQRDALTHPLGLAPGLQYVAHGARDHRARALVCQGVQQRQQLESALAAAEGKQLRDHDAGAKACRQVQ